MSQVANATARQSMMLYMDEAELLLWRVERLRAAIDKLEDGNISAFGRRMGYEDGSYIGQMLRGTRPVAEKFIRKFEEEQSLPDWFDHRVRHEGAEYQLRIELLNRQIPDHVLQTFLDVVKQYPPRKRVA